MGVYTHIVLLALLIHSVVMSEKVSAEILPSVKYQSQSIKEPKPGNIRGLQLGSDLKAEDLASGSMNITLPVSFPHKKSTIQVPLDFSYSINGGLSELGHGFSIGGYMLTLSSSLGELWESNPTLSTPWGSFVFIDGNRKYQLLTSAGKISLDFSGDRLLVKDSYGKSFVYQSIKDREGRAYKWYLKSVVSGYGDRTDFTYLKDRYKWLLDEVSWGSSERLFYKARFAYDDLDRQIKYYDNAGNRADFKFRLSSIIFANYGGKTLHRYDLEYAQQELSPLYYLKRFTKVNPSGEKEPPLDFSYNFNEDGTFEKQDVSADVIGFLKKSMNRDFWARTVSFHDFNSDGYVDLERASDLSVIVSNRDGSYDQPTSNLTSAPDKQCGRTNREIKRREPRKFFKPFGPLHDSHTIFIDGKFPNMEMIVCNLNGESVYQKELSKSNIDLTRHSRIIDINKDNLPDIVTLSVDKIEVIYNISKGDTINFSDPVSSQVSSKRDFLRNYLIYDINGDGHLDIITRNSRSILVSLGSGDLRFDDYDIVPFYERSGKAISFDLLKVQLTPVDLNKDGLLDIVVSSRTGELRAFLNNSTHFDRLQSNELTQYRQKISYPTKLSLSGEQNDSISFLDHQSKTIVSLALSNAGTGLLARADNNMGNLIEFRYGKSTTGDFKLSKKIHISEKINKVSGSGTMKDSFSVSDQVINNDNARFMGFRNVVHKTPSQRFSYEFDHRPLNPPMMLRKEVVDLSFPNMIRTNENSWKIQVNSHGRNYYLLEKSRDIIGNRGGVPKVLETVEYQYKPDSLCELSAKISTTNGSITVTNKHANLWSSGKCLSVEKKIDYNSLASRGGVKKSYKVAYKYNDQGDIISAKKIARNISSGYTLSIDRFGRVVKSVENGVSRQFKYLDSSRILTSVILPSGQIKSQRLDDEDRIVSISSNNGRSDRIIINKFSYDGYDRLTNIWRNINNVNLPKPHSTFSYNMPSSSRPAITKSTKMIGAKDRPLELSEVYDTQGQIITKLLKVNGDAQWDFFTTRSPDGLSTTVSSPDSLVTSLENLDYSQLNAKDSDHVLNVEASASYGPTKMMKIIDDNSTMVEKRKVSLVGGLLKVSKVLNENNKFTYFINPLNQKIVKIIDQNQSEFTYSYDVMDNLIGVKLPGNISINVQRDEIGQITKVSRSDLGRIEFRYDRDRGLLIERNRFDLNGKIVVAQKFSYDKNSNLVSVSRSGGNKNLSTQLYWNGDKPGSSQRNQNQLGLLSGFASGDYSQTLKYNDYGDIDTHTVKFKNQTLEHKIIYNNYGTKQQVKYKLNGSFVPSHQKKYKHADGYLKTFEFGRNNFTIHRDSFGKIKSISLPNGYQYIVSRDQKSKAQVGYKVLDENGDNLVDYTFDRDEFSNIVMTKFKNKTSNNVSVFDYDDRMFLVNESGANQTQNYKYSNNGRLDSGINDYRDRSGNISKHNGWDFQFSGSSLIGASKGNTKIVYHLDNDLRRVAKEVNGNVKWWKTGKLYIQSNKLIEPVVIEGIYLGFMIDGRFVFKATDHRGTILGDGFKTIARNAFGNSKEASSFEEVLDYALHAKDSDTGLINMGIRDYSVETGEFISADPFFFENPELCVGSPYECNLYTYAINNPMAILDIDGRYGIPLDFEYYAHHAALILKDYGIDVGLTAEAAAYDTVAVAAMVVNSEVQDAGAVANASVKTEMFNGAKAGGEVKVSLISGSVSVKKELKVAGYEKSVEGKLSSSGMDVKLLGGSKYVNAGIKASNSKDNFSKSKVGNIKLDRKLQVGSYVFKGKFDNSGKLSIQLGKGRAFKSGEAMVGGYMDFAVGEEGVKAAIPFFDRANQIKKRIKYIGK